MESPELSMMLPAPNIQNHASNLVILPSGDILCAWFSGTQEGMADISIYLSRLRRGEAEWSKPAKMSEDPTRSEQNPVLFPAPDGRLWLLWTSQRAGNQDSAIVMRRISADQGEHWDPPELFLGNPGSFVRQPIVVLGNGAWLLPIFRCVPIPGKKWSGDADYSAVMYSADRGATWSERVVPDSTGCVHMNILRLGDDSLLALFRSRWADHVYKSRSRDGGKTWDSPSATALPNNNSSIQATVLANGHLALVFNNSSAADARERRASLYDEIVDAEAEPVPSPTGKAPAVPDAGPRSAFWGAPRAPLTLAISTDGGLSWPRMRDLEVGDGFCMTNNSKESKNREYSYPSICQSPDGLIHISYTHFRQSIMYRRIEEGWVDGIIEDRIAVKMNDAV